MMTMNDEDDDAGQDKNAGTDTAYDTFVLLFIAKVKLLERSGTE